MSRPVGVIAALLISGMVLIGMPLAIQRPSEQELVARQCGSSPGFVVDGTVYCTHGPDPAPSGMDQFVPVSPAPRRASAAVCDGDGVSGKRYQVIYVYDGASRYGQYLNSFRQWAGDASTIFDQSAKQQGATRHVRYVTDERCNVVVDEVQLAPSDLQSFSATIAALKAKGYNRADRKYLVFADANVYCGIGTVLGDSSKSPSNRNNAGPSYSRVDSGCWGGFTAAHEIAHNLGAVQQDSPNHTAGWHCTDESDVMCYKDGPEQMRQVCPASQETILDCNKDDYFSVIPRQGEYLASHWSISESDFLIKADSSPTPVATATPTQEPVKTATAAPTQAAAAISVDAASVKAGDRLTVSLSGFKPRSQVAITLQGRLLRTVTVDADGGFQGPVRISSRTRPGNYLLVATGGSRASVQITVTR